MGFRAAVLSVALFRTAAAQQLDVPATAPVDQPVPVRVSGLAPGAIGRLRAVAVDAGGRPWIAQASFRADTLGTIATGRDAPLAGSYAGVDAGGLFNTMTVVGDTEGRERFAHRELARIVTSIVLEDTAGATLDSAVVERFFLAPGVQRTLVREDGLRAHFFLPARTPAPGVLVLGGSEGGFPDDVAALLASKGFAALSLAYFGAEDLPPELAEIPLEYFERALAWLGSQPSVVGERIGILATSKGAEAALTVASRSSGVKAVVAYAPSSVAWFCICQHPRPSWSASGQPVAAVPPGTDPSYRPARGQAIRPVVNYMYRLRRTPPGAVIPAERIRGPLLLIAGDDDQLWPSLLMARAIMERRAKRGGHPRDQLLTYPGAGHLIGKAYLPAGSTLIGGGRLETGGTRAANARAQGEAWARVLAFLQTVLEKGIEGVQGIEGGARGVSPSTPSIPSTPSTPSSSSLPPA